MKIDLKQFTSALAKVTAFASGEKNVPGVLLDVQDGHLNVCYSDGRKANIEGMDIENQEGDRHEKIVVNYQRLVDIVSVCQPSGKIVTNDIEILYESDKTLRVRATKAIPIQESEDSEVQYQVVSVFEQSIGWEKAGASMRTAILSRMDYDSIFNAEEYDEWNINELRSILDRVSTEKGRVAYISPKKQCAFVANMAYLSCLPIGNEYTSPIVVNSAVAKSISDILGKIANNDTVRVHVVDKKYCCIHTEDGSVGIWVEMAGASQVHLTTLGRYQEKKYMSYQLTFLKDVIKNVVDAAMSADKADKTVLRFGKSKLEEGMTELRIESGNSVASVKNDYTVICPGCIDPENNIDSLELPMSLKVLSDILGKCSSDYIGLDIDADANGTKCIRIAEIDFDKRGQAMEEVMMRLGLEADEPIPENEQMNFRDSTLEGMYYTISAK